jgi:hypothetical protein
MHDVLTQSKGGIAMNKRSISLKPVDRLNIITLMDNYVDVLLPNSEKVSRPPLATEGTFPADLLIAEHGLSQFVTVFTGVGKHSILFDTGYTRGGVLHNLGLLGLDLEGIEAIGRFAEAFPDSFVLNSVGSTFSLS